MGPLTGVVVGAVDVTAVGEFLTLFGFAPVADVPGAFSVDGRGPTVHLRQVDGPAAPGPTGVQCGARALDLYAADLDRALAALHAQPGSAAIASISPIGEIHLGPVHMRQVMITGPDALQIVLVESTHRRPSLLDEQPERLISEPYSVVWAVPDRDAEASAWVAGGATKGIDLAFSDPSLAAYLGLPSPSTAVHMCTLSDEAVSTGRLELMSFPEHPTSPPAPARNGIIAVQFDDAPTVALDATGRTAGGIAVIGQQ